jgi:hypothetical protein
MPTYQSKDLTTITYRKRALVMYPVQEHEFDILASGYNSLHTALFGVCFGAALTCWITFWVTKLGEPLATRFWTAALTFSIVSIYCGCMAVRDYRNARKILSTIKTETVDVTIAPTKA